MKYAALSKSTAVVRRKITCPRWGNQVLGRQPSLKAAQRMAESGKFRNRWNVLWCLNMGAVVAGTKYTVVSSERRTHEENLGWSIPWTDVILFIDELHTLIGAGGTWPEEALSMLQSILKPARSWWKSKLSDATTLDEYQKYIEKMQH